MHPLQTIFWKAISQDSDKESTRYLRKQQVLMFKVLTCKTSHKALVPDKNLSDGTNLTFFSGSLSAFIGSPPDIYMVEWKYKCWSCQGGQHPNWSFSKYYAAISDQQTTTSPHHNISPFYCYDWPNQNKSFLKENKSKTRRAILLWGLWGWSVFIAEGLGNKQQRLADYCNANTTVSLPPCLFFSMSYF